MGLAGHREASPMVPVFEDSPHQVQLSPQGRPLFLSEMAASGPEWSPSAGSASFQLQGGGERVPDMSSASESPEEPLENVDSKPWPRSCDSWSPGMGPEQTPGFGDIK